MSELGDKIRAMKAPALNEHGHGWNTALDRAAALADEHAATVAAAYEACPRCSGSGMVVGYGGDPALCPECRGDTVVPVNPCGALVAAAYEVCALAAQNARDSSGLDQDGTPYVGEEAHIHGSFVADAILQDIRAMTDADAAAALARIKAEARREGMREALAHCYVVENDGRRRTAEDCHAAILAEIGEAGNG